VRLVCGDVEPAFTGGTGGSTDIDTVSNIAITANS